MDRDPACHNRMTRLMTACWLLVSLVSADYSKPEELAYGQVIHSSETSSNTFIVPPINNTDPKASADQGNCYITVTSAHVTFLDSYSNLFESFP